LERRQTVEVGIVSGDPFATENALDVHQEGGRFDRGWLETEGRVRALFKLLMGVGNEVDEDSIMHNAEGAYRGLKVEKSEE